MKPNKSNSSSKKTQIEKMFDSISHEYDSLNRILTFGSDIRWRKKIVSLAKQNNPKYILDVATGTADIALELSKISDSNIIGVDISKKMLDIGKAKVKSRKLSNKINLESGDAENLVYSDESFDVVTIGFGVRNFQNLEKGLKESNRVLKKGGLIIILETSVPENYIVKYFYLLFTRAFIPLVGSIFSKDKSAYDYLQKSAEKFPIGKDFISILKKCGFKNIHIKPQMLGASTIYLGNT